MTGNIILLYKTGLFVNPTVIDDPIRSLIMIDKTDHNRLFIYLSFFLCFYHVLLGSSLFDVGVAG